MSDSSELIAQQILNASINKRNWKDVMYNVKVFGAKGDGIYDDTQAVQDAIDTALFNNATLVYFPPGAYKVTSLTYAETIHFIGDNASFVGYAGEITQLGSGSSLGVYNVASYESIQATIDAAKTGGGGTVHCPPGTYTEDVLIDSDNITLSLDCAAVITGKVTMQGGGFSKSNSVSLTGAWASFPVGTTVFSGNFSALSIGDKVVIETTVQDGLINQVGVDFATVVSASNTQLVIDLPTKFAYNNPVISKLSSARYVVGSITSDDTTITGDFTSQLAVGDIVRFENRNGTGGVSSSTAYFELNKVVAIDTSTVTFENKFTHSFTDYWVIKLNYISNISLTGGKINTLFVGYVTNFHMDKLAVGLTTDSDGYAMSLRYLYEFFISGVDVEVINKPIGVDAVFNYNGFFSNIVASGSRGSTDNGNFKLMSHVNVVVDTVVSTDTQSTGSEADMPFMIDYYYTPYKCWNNKLTIDSVSAAGNKNAEDLGKPDVWLIGLKNSTVNNVVSNNPIRVSNCYSVILSNLVNDSLLVFDESCNLVSVNGFRCGSIDMTATTQVSLSNGILTSKDALNSRIIFIHGVCSNITLRDIYMTVSTFDSIYLQDCDKIQIDGVTDEAAGTNSVVHGINATNIIYGRNYFKAATPVNTTSIAPVKDYGIPKGVIVPIFVLGRNSYAAKGNITGDGTAYKCVFDGDGINFSNKNNVVAGQSTFTVAKEAAGNYVFTGSIGLENVGSAHTLAELYIRKNNTQNYYLDYTSLTVTGTIKVFLNGSVIIPLVADDYIELFVKVSGGTKVVTWAFSELGGQFAGTLLFAQ
ncbi:glycosyl hydrolase family 28-related protein [Paenibacillus sp. LjRoot56]|uniref:glycosyl hydrolase family 28-related protein n=1 Tax=Paenibacillus sp. LjRoot56 TaxID=3342333 RepID=UPI003ECD720E